MDKGVDYNSIKLDIKHISMVSTKQYSRFTKVIIFYKVFLNSLSEKNAVLC